MLYCCCLSTNNKDDLWHRKQRLLTPGAPEPSGLLRSGAPDPPTSRLLRIRGSWPPQGSWPPGLLHFQLKLKLFRFHYYDEWNCILSLSCHLHSQTICWRRWDDNACLDGWKFYLPWDTRETPGKHPGKTRERPGKHLLFRKFILFIWQY